MLESRHLVALAILVASVNAGVVPTYPAAPVAYASPIAKISAPLPYAAPPLAYAQPIARVAAPLARYPAPVAYASPLAKVAAPVAYAAAPAYAKAVVPAAVDTDYDPNPSYSYAYDIQDALTGDSKSQHESRQGDSVQGSYSLVEPDGTRRIVEYTADPHNGFNAVVHREPAVVQKAVVAAHAPVAYAAAPVAKYAAAPVAYSAYH